MKIAMCADVHLSAREKEWSLAVLKELVSKAEAEASLLLIGGDLFDSLDDAQELRKDYDSIIEASKLKQVIWAAGNHDAKNPSGSMALAGLMQLAFGSKTQLVCDIRKNPEDRENNPVHYTGNSEFELIVIPFLEKPEWYSYAMLPEKKAKRIILAHGTHADVAVSEESENCLFPRGFEKLFNADFMLLGHIHKRSSGDAWLYPGSARIWRRGESGEHGFVFYDTQTDEVTFVPLPSGGCYQEMNIYIDNALPELTVPDVPYLYLDVNLYGTVQDDSSAQAIIRDLTAKLGQHCIKLNINTDNLKTTTLLAQNPVWEAFNKALENQMQSLDKEVIDCARRLFMERIIAGKK